jgi:type II secretory pathway component PulK
MDTQRAFMFSRLNAPRASRQGSVLILVLWVLFFLVTLTIAVGSHVAAAISAAERLWIRTESRSLAEAGAHQALAVAMRQTNAWDGVAEGAWNRDEAVFADVPVGDGFCSIHYTEVGRNGSIVTNAGIVGEDGKLNLNAIPANEPTKLALGVLLASVGELDAEASQAIVAAIEDWVDDDDEILTGGAESGYYASLSPAYKCANAPMRCISELRLIRGVDRELYERLVPYVTVYGSEHVNMNCAPEPVIAALAEAYSTGTPDPDACASLAEKIGEFRRAGGAFRTDDDILHPPEELELTGDEGSLFGGIPPSGLDRISSAFRGVASGVVGEDGHSGMSIEFIFDTDTGLFVYWHEL